MKIRCSVAKGKTIEKRIKREAHGRGETKTINIKEANEIINR